MEIIQIQFGILELFMFSFLKLVEMEKLEEEKIVMMEILKIWMVVLLIVKLNQIGNVNQNLQFVMEFVEIHL